MLKLNCAVIVAMVAVPECSPSRTILDYEDSDAQAGSTTGQEDSDSTTDDGGPLLDLGGESEPEQQPNDCDGLGTLSSPGVTQLVGPVHGGGRIYWGEWAEWGTNGEPDSVLTWRYEQLEPEDHVVLHSSVSSPAHSLVADEQYLYASYLDHNPMRIPVEGGPPEAIPGPLGYAESSSELLLQANHLYWLNHSIDEVTLMRTQLEPLNSDVLLDGPLGEQLTGSDEAGIYVLRPAGPSTDILRVDPILGIHDELISLAVTSENVGELYAVQDELYVVYTSVDTVQIDRVSLEGVATTIVEPGTYTLITHPLMFRDQLYFEFVDPELPVPEYAWGRVDPGGGAVESLGPEIEDSPLGDWQRWHPTLALEHCLVVRISYPQDANNVPFEINHFFDD